MLATQARLLLVDTDRDAARALAAALAPRGIAVGAVAEPGLASAGVVRFGASVVLVAETLAGSSGLHVLAQLRADPRTLHLPIALLAERADPDEVLTALRAGAADFFLEPIRPEVDLAPLLTLAAQPRAPGAPYDAPLGERLLRAAARLGLSGELVGNDGTARFQQGHLAAAQSGPLSGEAALDAILEGPHLAFRVDAAAPMTMARPASVELEVDVELVEEVTEAEPQPRPARCLLVDDEPDLLRLFGTFLRRSGLEVTTAADGVEGFDACLAQRPDVVVADINMPRLDGWGLLRRIRSDVRVAETPVVFLSAQDDYRESLRAVGAGAQDYLAKAGKLDQLARRVREVLVPRETALAALLEGSGAHGRVEHLGVRWLLEQLARTGRTGVLAVADALGVFNVGLDAGAAVFAAGQQGPERVAGLDALARLVQLRSGDMQFLPDVPAPMQNLEPEALPTLLERLAERAAAQEASLLESLLVKAGRVEMDPAIFTLYERFCSPQAREVASYIRLGKSPRQILAESQLSPLELEETLRDMVRRQVIRLHA